jgi:ABC-2 type transport system permease protein
MITVIARKEITEYRRDGRILALLGLTATLLLIALVTGWVTQSERQRQAQQLQRDDQATFVKQGDKPTHSAAHFGRMAYKPVPALAAFDPGSSPYLGQVIWLEAHRQGPAMFRPAEDALELRRLSDLSVAGVLTLLLPLVIFLLGSGAVVGERERDTWSHALSSGATQEQLFLGKLTAVATVGIGSALVAVLSSTGIAIASSLDVIDSLARAAWLLALYALYGAVSCSIAFIVSALARSSVSALLILLSVWAVSTVIAPRVAADVANRLHPTPDSASFWKQTSDAIRDSKPKRGSDEYKAIERDVLSRTLGRTVTAEEASAVQLNRQGLSLEIGELVAAKAFDAAYDRLYATYEAQRHVRQWFALLAPSISLQHISSALTGTDIEAHRDFTRAAEQQRRLIIRLMNEDLMRGGAQAGNAYLSTRRLWESIPNFVYHPPTLAGSVRHVIWDIVILTLWAVASLLIAWRAVVRSSPR